MNLIFLTVAGFAMADDLFSTPPLPAQGYRIAQGCFGMRRHPIFRVRRMHKGIDLNQTPLGTPVRSIGPGKIVYAGWGKGFGRIVIIQHSNGYLSSYAHLSSFGKGIKIGAQVDSGTQIGRVGSTGYSTGPHLEFEIRKGWARSYQGFLAQKPIDPMLAMGRVLIASSRDRANHCTIGGWRGGQSAPRVSSRGAVTR